MYFGLGGVSRLAHRLEQATRPLVTREPRRRRRRPSLRADRGLTPDLTERVGQSRCPYCHDEVTDPATTYTCSGCQIQTHRDCVAELGACPTLGCGPKTATPAASYKPAPPRAPERAPVKAPAARQRWKERAEDTNPMRPVLAGLCGFGVVFMGLGMLAGTPVPHLPRLVPYPPLWGFCAAIVVGGLCAWAFARE